MKSISISLLFTLLLLISCGTTPTQPSINCNCPVPYGSDQPGIGPKLPQYAHYSLKVSHDGKKLGFVSGNTSKILDLESRKVTVVDIQNLLPESVKILSSRIEDWCPYDPDIVLLSCRTLTDTNGTGEYISGVNLYTFSLVTQELVRVTPIQFDKAGSNLNTSYPIQWLHSTYFRDKNIYSTKGKDYFELFTPIGGIYHVQSGTLSPNLRLDFVQYPSKPKLRIRKRELKILGLIP